MCEKLAYRFKKITEKSINQAVDEVFEESYKKLCEDMKKSAENLNYNFYFNIDGYCDDSNIQNIIKDRILESLNNDGFEVYKNDCGYFKYIVSWRID